MVSTMQLKLLILWHLSPTAFLIPHLHSSDRKFLKGKTPVLLLPISQDSGEK